MLKTLYPNLEAELIRYKISKYSLAKAIGISPSSMYSKIGGDTAFTIDELKAIRLTLEIKTNEKFTLDYLFLESV